VLHTVATGRNPEHIISHRSAYPAGTRTSENSPLLHGLGAAYGALSLAYFENPPNFAPTAFSER
jgi:hypothetical protein